MGFRLKTFFSRNLFSICYLLFWAIIFAGSYIPWFSNYTRVPLDRYYYGAEEYPLDMTGNLATMRQGYLGDWKGYFNYTTEIPTKPTFLKMEYILLGHLSRITGVDPIDMFYVARLVLGFCWMIVLYFIIRHVFRKELDRIAAAFFILLSTSITLPMEEYPFVKVGITDMLVFNRLTLQMPHYALGSLGGILSLFALSRVIERSRRKIIWFCLSLLSGFIAAWTYAPTMVCIFTTFPLFIWIRLYHLRNIRTVLGEVWLLTVYVVVMLIPILYVRHSVAVTWSEFNLPERMEMLNPFFLTFWEYILAIGITFILGWIGVIRTLKNGQVFLLFLLPWLLLHPLGKYILSPKLDLNYIRYFLTPYYVAFGFLAVSGVYVCHRVSLRFFRSLSTRGVLVTIIILSTLASSLTYYKGLKKVRLCFCNVRDYDYAYPKKELMSALFWLEKQKKPEEVVVSDVFAGVLIPAFTGNRVYTSWWYHLSRGPNLKESIWLSVSFYREDLSVSDAKRFMRKMNAGYVLVSDQERQYVTGGDLSYPFLTAVFRKGNTVIYEVDKTKVNE